MRFDGVSADLTAIGFAGLQEYRTVSGDLVLEGTGGELRMKGVSSDISLRAEAPLRSLEINTVSGDVSALRPASSSCARPRSVATSSSRDILADGPEHRIETVSGDARSASSAA